MAIWGSAVIANLMTQTLYFKFGASEEAVFIFTAIGVESWGA